MYHTCPLFDEKTLIESINKPNFPDIAVKTCIEPYLITDKMIEDIEKLSLIPGEKHIFIKRNTIFNTLIHTLEDIIPQLAVFIISNNLTDFKKKVIRSIKDEIINLITLYTNLLKQIK